MNRHSTHFIVFIIAAILAEAVTHNAHGQENHPAFGAIHTSQLTVESEVTDVPKLEAKAVDILRQVGTVTGETMTLAEARAKVRVDEHGNPDPNGRTDVARCLEIVIINWLKGIAQAKVVASTVANQHPVPAGEG